MPLVIRDLSLHMQGKKLGFQRVLDLLRHLSDAKHTPLGKERGKQFGTGITHIHHCFCLPFFCQPFSCPPFSCPSFSCPPFFCPSFSCQPFFCQPFFCQPFFCLISSQ